MLIIWYPGMNVNGADPIAQRRVKSFEESHEAEGRISGMTRIPNFAQAFLWFYKKKTKQRFQNGKPMFLINYLLPLIVVWLGVMVIYGMVDHTFLRIFFFVLGMGFIISSFGLVATYSTGPFKEIEKETARVLLSGEAGKWTRAEKSQFIEELLWDRYKKFKKDNVVYTRVLF